MISGVNSAKFVLFLCGISALILSPQASARSIHPGPWQRTVYTSDFIGVVRCKTAAYPKGDDGHGHHYLLFDCEVIESVKGDGPGESFTVSCGTDDPHFDYGDPKPEAGKSFALSVIAEYSPEGDPPIAPAKYQLGRLCPMISSPDTEYPPGFDIFSPTPDHPKNFTDFLKAAKLFLLLPLEEQAFQSMKSIAVVEAQPSRGRTRYFPQYAKAADATDTVSLVKILLAAAEANKDGSFLAVRILELGRHDCLAALEANRADAERILGPNYKRVKSHIEWRIKKVG